jgi:ribonuclease D
VRLVRTREDAQAALAALLACDAIGFDTESKPTFQKGEVSTGPHLVQLADDTHAWLFQIGAASSPGVACASRSCARCWSRPTILKVGFGLGDDLRRLRAKLGIETRNVIDLATALRRDGRERNAWGAKTAVARFFGQRLQKSRRITTTNWACRACPNSRSSTRPTTPTSPCASTATGANISRPPPKAPQAMPPASPRARGQGRRRSPSTGRRRRPDPGPR